MKMVGVMWSLPFVKRNWATQVVSQHSQTVIQLQENYKDQVGLSPSMTTTIPPPQTQKQRQSLQTLTRHGVARLVAPKMLTIQGGVGSFYRFLRGYISQIVN